MDANTVTGILILVAIGLYHIISDYLQRKKAINVKDDVYTIDDRLKDWRNHLLQDIQYMEVLESKIYSVVESAILNCTLTEEQKESILNSNVGNKVAEELYNSLERPTTAAPVYDIFSVQRKLRKQDITTPK